MEIRKNSGPLKWILIGISTLFLIVMLILPLTYVLVTAFGEGIKVFVASVTDYYALKAIGLTLEVTLIAVVVNTIFGIAASWCITRFQFHGKKILSTLIDLPLTISPVIAGLIYILTFVGLGALLGGGGAVMDELQQNGPGSGPLPVPLWLAAVLLLAVLALYAVSWRVSVAWYGKYKK